MKKFIVQTFLFLLCSAATQATTISGGPNICIGVPSTLTIDTSGGTWSSNNAARATIVAATGVITGISAGTCVISYNLPLATFTAVISVYPQPSAISGAASLCEGATAGLSNSTSGSGSWSSGSPGIAGIGTGSGVVSGVSAGTSVITYTMYSGCFTTRTETVNAAPTTISGSNSMCVGTNQTLTSATSGGTWTSSATSVATIGSSSGVVNGLIGGSTTIVYSLGAGCTRAFTLSVVNLPAAITGPLSVCAGNTPTLSSTTTGGTWSSSNTSVATIGSSTGTIGTVSSGTSNITYTLGTGCSRSAVVTVNAALAANTGSAVLCTGQTSTLTNATGGGTWSSSNTAKATVGLSSGIVSGVSAGTANITYMIGSGCSAVTQVTVNSTPASITGTATLCVGSTTTLSHPVSGGTWSCSNTARATVGASNGIVTGVSIGTATITYMVSAGCYRTITISVGSGVSAISGTASVCVGATTTLTCATTGGAWTSGNTGIASVGSATGIVTGVSAGTAVISYTVSSSGCYATREVTVNAGGTVSGALNTCVGSTSSLSSSVSGGTWGSSNTGVATIGSTSGIVTGISTGTTTISYITGTGCVATIVATVGSLPSSITGTAITCLGSTTTLANVTSGGTWSSSNTSVATIGSSSGVVTGATAGTSIISYVAGPGCSTTVEVTVNVDAGTISGTLTIPTGSASFLSSTISGGTWSSSDISVATAGSSTGIVTGVSAGTSPITYSLAGGCNSAVTVTVNAASTGGISGNMHLPFGSAALLSSPVGGGTWSSGAASVASIGSSSGVVRGVGGGTATISYVSAGILLTAVVTVSSASAYISGPDKICERTVRFMSASKGGGLWSSSNPSVVTINSTSGMMTGMNVGTSIITYSIDGGTAAYPVAVFHIPSATTGTSSISIGDSTALSNSTSGGSWTSSNGNIAIVNSTGMVTGINAGTANITYATGAGCVDVKTVTVGAGILAINGPVRLCASGNTTLTSTIAGGTWSSSNPAVGTIGITSGVLHGVAAGTTTISYTRLGSVATLVATVNTVISSTITGATSLNVGDTTTLSNTTSGGMWSSLNVLVGTVDPTSGVVTGMSTGTVVIRYSVGSSCSTGRAITVNSVPSVITGNTAVCVGTTTTLYNATSGGTWSSSNPAVAIIDSVSGVVSGVSAGTTIITYAIPGDYITLNLTVSASLGAITVGNDSICLGSVTTFSDGTYGGTWSSSNTAIASVDPVTGIVEGMTTGAATITHSAGGGCITTKAITVRNVSSSAACFQLGGPPPYGGLSGFSNENGLSGITVTYISNIAQISGNSIINGVESSTMYPVGGTPLSKTYITIDSVHADPYAGYPSNWQVIGFRLLSVSHSGCTWAGNPFLCGAGYPSPYFRPGSEDVIAGSTREGISVFPNPTSGDVSIEAEQSGMAVILSLDGREIMHRAVAKGINNISFPYGVVTGIYLVRFKGDDGSIQTLKLVYEP